MAMAVSLPTAGTRRELQEFFRRRSIRLIGGSILTDEKTGEKIMSLSIDLNGRATAGNWKVDMHKELPWVFNLADKVVVDGIAI